LTIPILMMVKEEMTQRK